ncbi:MAG: FxsA family protein [Geminicoccaceae bacterium]
MSPAFILFILLVAVPIVEVATFIQVGGLIGLWPTIAMVILTAVVGSIIIRRQGLGLIQTVQRQMAEGALPVFEVFSGLCLLVAGALLLTPGFITDTMGFLLLWPGLRRMVYARFRDRIDIQSRSFGSAQTRRGDVIDGEYEEVVDTEDMPPPRGNWGRPSGPER